MAREYRNFSREEKIKAVKMVLEDGKSQMEVERSVLGKRKSTGTINRWIREYILRLLFKENSERGLQNHPFVEVALNLTQGRNINFLIYLLYFLFLTWTTLARLQGWDPLISHDYIDGATPAFLVHIAYTNMAFRLHDVDLKMDTMIKFMMKAYDINVLQFKTENN